MYCTGLLRHAHVTTWHHVMMCRRHQWVMVHAVSCHVRLHHVRRSHSSTHTCVPLGMCCLLRGSPAVSSCCCGCCSVRRSILWRCCVVLRAVNGQVHLLPRLLVYHREGPHRCLLFRTQMQAGCPESLVHAGRLNAFSPAESPVSNSSSLLCNHGSTAHRDTPQYGHDCTLSDRMTLHRSIEATCCGVSLYLSCESSSPTGVKKNCDCKYTSCKHHVRFASTVCGLQVEVQEFVFGIAWKRSYYAKNV